MNELLFTLLQLSASLLMIVEQHPELPPALRESSIALASNAIASAAQFGTGESQQVQPISIDVDVNVDKLFATQYFLPDGRWVSLGVPAADGTLLTLVDESISFGDLNVSDNYDDAVVVLRHETPGATTKHYLAVVINNSGKLAHTGLILLPEFSKIMDHRITPGRFRFVFKTRPGEETNRVFEFRYEGGTLVRE